MAIFKKRWQHFIPHLDIYISVPAIRVSTKVMVAEADTMRSTYLGFEWAVWKWKGFIRLYRMQSEFLAHKTGMTEDDITMIDKDGCWISKKYNLRHYCPLHWGLLHNGK